MPFLLPAMLYSAGSDAWVLLRLVALVPLEGRGLHCSGAGATGIRSQPGMSRGGNCEQRNLIKTVGNTA